MAFADWTLLNSGGPFGSVAITFANPIANLGSVQWNRGPDGHGSEVYIVSRNTGTGVMTGKFATLIRPDTTIKNTNSFQACILVQTPVVVSSRCYYIRLESMGNYFLRRGRVDATSIEVTFYNNVALPWTMVTGSVYAVGLCWQQNPGDSSLLLETMFSPGVVSNPAQLDASGIPTYVGQMIIDRTTIDSSGQITTPGTESLNYFCVGSPGEANEITNDQTTAIVPP